MTDIGIVGAGAGAAAAAFVLSDARPISSTDTSMSINSRPSVRN